MYSDGKTEARPILKGQGVGASFAKGLEKILVSVSSAIDRGELSPAFITLGCGLGAGIIITDLQGGTVSFLQGLVRLEQSV